MRPSSWFTSSSYPFETKRIIKKTRRDTIIKKCCIFFIFKHFPNTTVLKFDCFCLFPDNRPFVIHQEIHIQPIRVGPLFLKIILNVFK